MLSARYADLPEVASRLSSNYSQADPFPNIVLDDFFELNFLQSVLAEFPNLEEVDALRFKNRREVKLASLGESSFGPKTKELMHFLNSEPFLCFLQKLTGIDEPLIGDPYFFGGGQHEIKPGGLLKVHADFNKHVKLKLDRRLNFLIYLNENWEESFGGHFELWDENMNACKKRILPVMNRVAIFSTTDFSFHGHPDPLKCPENMSRKSLALYYYSNGRPAIEINSGLEDHSTLFKERPGSDEGLFAEELEGKSSSLKSFARDIAPPILWRLFHKLFRN
jgi:hypothetical protein